MDLSSRTVLPRNEIMFSTCSPLLVVVSLWCFLTLPCITILPLKIHESALVPYFDDKWVYVWCCILGFLTCVVLRKVYENTKTCTKKVFIKSSRMETIILMAKEILELDPKSVVLSSSPLSSAQRFGYIPAKLLNFCSIQGLETKKMGFCFTEKCFQRLLSTTSSV